MRIVGRWAPDGRGVFLPVVQVQVRSRDGEQPRTRFLVDSGSDGTALSRETLDLLQLPSLPSASVRLNGIGGRTSGVLVEATLLLEGEGGGVALFPGLYAAFLDPAASDIDLLGRDILDQFRVIASRPDDEVLLLRHPHAYRVVEAP